MARRWNDFFRVSEIGINYAQEIFDELKRLPGVPFDYPEDGCYARALAMSRHLESRGFSTGNIFLQGDLRVETSRSPKGYVEWGYHVAPIMMVDIGGQRTPYVFDPSLFDRPVPVEEWVSIQTRHNTGRGRRFYTRRFTYGLYSDPNQRQWLPDDVADANRTNEEYMRLQEERRKERETRRN